MLPHPIANPPNPWATTDVEYLEGDTPNAPLHIYEDQTRAILSKNDSPDVGFSWSVNPYRGCFHGCAYCYARPTHEYLSFGAGTDFERRIVVKPRAPELLREAFEKKSWNGELVVFSGVTDCYQPIEASYRLTRGCLEACAEYKNPCGLITKSPLVERDIDVLAALSKVTRVSVAVSVPFWDPEKARAMEPFVATPQRRVRTIERLAARGIRVGVMAAPIIPGLGDEEIGDVLRAAKDAGATFAGYVLLRLPGPVKDVFEERLRATLPLRAERVLRRVRETRGGTMYDARFGTRGTGEGVYAESIAQLFAQTAHKLGLESSRPKRRVLGRRAGRHVRAPTGAGKGEDAAPLVLAGTVRSPPLFRTGAQLRQRWLAIVVVGHLLVGVPRALPDDAAAADERGGKEDPFGTRAAETRGVTTGARRRMGGRLAHFDVHEPRPAERPPGTVHRMNHEPERPH